MTPNITLIAAMDQNRVIGRNGELPWHYPKDLQHFRETTTGHPVIMGRVTYESIVEQTGQPLPNRDNLVLTTRTLSVPYENVYAVQSLDDAIETATTCLDGSTNATVYVAGGASIYEQFLPRADRMILTEIHTTHDGDTYFPEWDTDRWTEVDRTDYDDLSFVTYESQ